MLWSAWCGWDGHASKVRVTIHMLLEANCACIFTHVYISHLLFVTSKRFDYYGPPGGPMEPGRGGRGGQFPGRLGRGRGRGGRMPPGGFGTPNPDHMTPPGGDYFS